ncbi:tRNA (guanine(37)-N1)-methyltransferase-like [Mizuhopecten yessoensis]|uniref:tRNA (guanine(37)-N1)-methyltransferase n=1 Tax=Mizuhopecten yessoensis TaxID=6573 RepID=A0A210PQ81_MIZYE|nr:tRNA (guanine(37)-N1)-methyltransferase-like [Mizuhopecten yessoensis]OWF38643.1 tRNA (guanine(37)-N1)-methyltransferase [Mizuhopecten yessoensis]
MIPLHIFRTTIRTISFIHRKVSAVRYVSNYVDSNIRRQILDCLQSQRICTSARYMATSEKVEPTCAQNDQSKEPIRFQTDGSEASQTSPNGLSETDVHPKASPPVSVLGMKVLDKEKFLKKVTVQALPVRRKKMKLLAKYFGEWTFKECPVTVKGMGTEKEKDFKIVVFHPDKVTCVEDLGEDFKNKLIEAEVDLSEWFEDDVELNYDSWKAKEILLAIIPKELGNVSGYSIVGHIIHLNLRENLLEYKEIIGQVLLEKHHYIRTVVNKLSTIDNTFRNFKMEILAGEDDTITTVKENGVTFKFDFAKVYWNTRLGTEHARIANQLQRGDLMFDVFAGVGPFAVLAGRRGVDVFANDLNPHSYESLLENATLNKINTKVTCSNLDGRDFIRSVMKPELLRRWQLDYMNIHKTFVVMNLPGLAVTFLDEFIGLLSDKACDQDEYPDHLLPFVHCHVFGKADDTRQAARELAEENLGESLPDDATIKFVRNVAPNKDMYCVAFNVPRHLLFRSDKNTTTSQQHANEEPPEKKMKPCDEQ